VKILIAEDHSLYRDGLRQLLLEYMENAEVIEACNHEQAYSMISGENEIDIILYDLYMPDGEGIVSISRIVSNFPEIPIIALSGSTSLSDMSSVINSGAMGYISKNETNAVIVSAVQLVIAGGMYVPPALVKDVNTDITKEPRKIGLTDRQIDVLKCLMDGKSNKEIARQLKLTDTTVKVHLSTIYKVLDVKNRTQAAIEAEKLNLFTEKLDATN